MRSHRNDSCIGVAMMITYVLRMWKLGTCCSLHPDDGLCMPFLSLFHVSRAPPPPGVCCGGNDCPQGHAHSRRHGHACQSVLREPAPADFPGPHSHLCLVPCYEGFGTLDRPHGGAVLLKAQLAHGLPPNLGRLVGGGPRAGAAVAARTFSLVSALSERRNTELAAHEGATLLHLVPSAPPTLAVGFVPWSVASEKGAARRTSGADGVLYH